MGATNCCCSAEGTRFRDPRACAPEPQALAAALSVVDGLVEGEPAEKSRQGGSSGAASSSTSRAPDYCGGMDRYTDWRSMRRVLASGDVVLIRGDFVEHKWRSGSPLPRRQQLPARAAWDVDELFACVEDETQVPPVFLALSYGWITEEHPDPQGFHLQTFAPLLRHFAQHHHVGVDKVALFIDWCSLPQHPRSNSDLAVYRRAVHDVDLWYAHMHTNVWLLSQLPEQQAKRPFSVRGWPSFEQALAAMIKPVDAVLDLGLLEPKVRCTEWVDVARQCRAPRRPLRVPEHFAHDLKRRKFRASADRQLVMEKYQEVFHRVVSVAEEMYFCNLGWHDDDVEVLALALPFFGKLRELDLHGNQISTPGALALVDVVTRCDPIQKLNITGNCIGQEALTLLEEAWLRAEKRPAGLQIGSQQSERSRFCSLVARQAAFEARFETTVKKMHMNLRSGSEAAVAASAASIGAEVWGQQLSEERDTPTSNSLLLGQVMGNSWKEELPAEPEAWPAEVPWASKLCPQATAAGAIHNDLCEQCCLEWMGLEDLARQRSAAN